MLVYLNRPFFPFRKSSKKYSREVLTNFSKPIKKNNNSFLAKKRISEILNEFSKDHGIQPRMAIELEFTLRDHKGQPYRLKNDEFKALETLLKQKYSSLKRIDYDGKYDLEAVFDSQDSNPLALVNDIDSFKINLKRIIRNLNQQNRGFFNGEKLSMCLNPYQPDISRFSSNTYGLHINMSLYKDGKNIFASDKELLYKVASNILDVQGASFTLASGKTGIERISKGNTSPKILAIRRNLAGGGEPRLNSLINLLAGFAPFSLLRLTNQGASFDLAQIGLDFTSILLLLITRTKSQNPSIGIRELEKNPLFKWVPSKRLIKSSSETRIENRIPGADQSIALGVLSTLYPSLVALKSKDSAPSADRPFEQNAEELLSEVVDNVDKLKEIYGEDLFSSLYVNAVKQLLN